MLVETFTEIDSFSFDDIIVPFPKSKVYSLSELDVKVVQLSVWFLFDSVPIGIVFEHDKFIVDVSPFNIKELLLKLIIPIFVVFSEYIIYIEEPISREDW